MPDSPNPHEVAGAAPWQQSIYDHLHRIAESALAKETAAHSLQPTLLVNDAYMKLLEQRNVDSADRQQILAAGANIIRRLLVDHARRRRSQKRGGSTGRGVPLQISLPGDDVNTIDLIDLNDALDALAGENTRAAQVVELKFFGGLTGEEVAKQLQTSLRTVNNDWRFAKAWMYRTLKSTD